jgi:hypothetical protein
MNPGTPLLCATGIAVVIASGCGVVGPSCVAQQKTGAVTTINGEVSAGAVAMHRVPYGTEGSQNNLRISWVGQSTGNPRIKVYATKVDCVDFSPANQSGACASIGGGGGTLSPTARQCVIDRTCQPTADDIVQNSLTVTNGRGNPEVLGQPAEYKLWVVGDPERNVSYGIEITWFRGPDC